MNQLLKYFIILVLSFYLLPSSSIGQANVDSLMQIWEDTTLPQKNRLTALYEAASELIHANPSRALQLNDTLNREASNPEFSAYLDTLRLDFLKNLAYKYLNISPDTAIYVSRQLLRLSKKVNNNRGEVRAYRRLGKAYTHKGELDSAFMYFGASMKLSRKMKDGALIVIGYDDYAGLMVSEGKYEAALTYYDSALQLCKVYDLTSELANSYNNKGATLYYLGDFRNAIDYYSRSLKIDEKLGNFHKVASTKANIGMLYHRIGDLDIGFEKLREAYQYYEEQNQTKTPKALQTLGILASIESDRGNYEEAKKHFSQILKYAMELDNPTLVASAFMNRGLVSARMKDYENAILDYTESIQIAEPTGNIQTLQTAFANLGDAYLDMGKLDEAIQASHRVLELYQETPLIFGAQVAYATLYEAYKRKGRYETALEMYEKHVLLRDSLASEASRKKIIDQEYAYKYEKKALSDSLKLVAAHELTLTAEKLEFKKKRAQIVFFLGGLLVATILSFFILQRIRKQKFLAEKKYIAHKAAIEKEDAERARFARDLHDQVGSTLTVSLFNLQPLKKPLKDNPRQIENLNNSIASIQTAMNEIRRISYDLMPESLESGGLISAVKELFDKIRTSNGIQIRSEFPDSLNFLNKTEEVQAYRIIKELVNNTLKYAEASFITLTMEIKDKAFHMTYADDGKGLDLAKGMAHSIKKGQGLVGIQERCTMIDADFQMISSPGNGFTFNLSKDIKK